MFFRYDYNCKLLVISNLPSLVFLTIAIYSYLNSSDAFYWFALLVIIATINSFAFIRNIGIRIRKGKVIIIDELFYRCFSLSEVKYVKVNEINKEKQSNLYGFLNEFYHYSTYMTNCEYTYNNGKVFEVVFYLKNGTTERTFFGWMYREKNEATVNKIQAKLIDFADNINKLCKNTK